MVIFQLVRMVQNTKKKINRGTNVGKYHAIAGVLASIAMMGGGLLAGKVGINIIFYITAGFFFISSIILFYIKENLKRS